MADISFCFCFLSYKLPVVQMRGLWFLAENIPCLGKNPSCLLDFAVIQGYVAEVTNALMARLQKE